MERGELPAADSPRPVVPEPPVRGPSLSLLLDALKRAEQEKLAARPNAPPRRVRRADAAHAARGAQRSPRAAAEPLERDPSRRRRARPGAAPRRAAPGERAGAQAVFAGEGRRPRGEPAPSRVRRCRGRRHRRAADRRAGAYVWSRRLNALGIEPRPPRRAGLGAAGSQRRRQRAPAAARTRPRCCRRPPRSPPPASGVRLPANPAAPPVAAVRRRGPVAAEPRRPPPAGAAAEQLRARPAARGARERRSAPPLRLDRACAGAASVPARDRRRLRGAAPGRPARARAAATRRRSPRTRPASTPCWGSPPSRRARATAPRPRALTARRSTLDPRNATALAGLAALADLSRPEAIEPRAARRPRALPAERGAALHARQPLRRRRARWTEAQVEYFEAHRLEPGNADVLYNLAVSARQPGPAAPRRASSTAAPSTPRARRRCSSTPRRRAPPRGAPALMGSLQPPALAGPARPDAPRQGHHQPGPAQHRAHRAEDASRRRSARCW